MSIERTIRLRDRREPGHLWADNKIYDVFGDELGQGGISLYMTLARLCYGHSVQASLRSLADHSRMSKDSVSRAMATLVRIGLVIERKAGKAKAVSTYTLTDAKALAREYVRQSVSRDLDAQSISQSVSGGDSALEGEPLEKPSNARANTSEGATDTLVSICLTQRQRYKTSASQESLSPRETDLSQKALNLSQNGHSLNKTQDTRQIHPLSPQGGRDGNATATAETEAPDPDGRQRGMWEVTNRVRLREGRLPVSWAVWVAEQKAAGAWPVIQNGNSNQFPNNGFRRTRKRSRPEATVGIFRGG